MEYTIINGELYHHGVKGMKWGVRNVRGHAGPGRYLTKKRQLAGDKKDLEYLNKGGHLSIGLTKKRQAAYDKKDRARLESRIAKTEQKLAEKQAKKERKAAINKEHKKLNKQASLGEKFMYNDATRRKAAKYIVDNNMSVKEAKSKAQHEAKRNTTIILGAYGALTIASLKIAKWA